jgi:hypothetical protein
MEESRYKLYLVAMENVRIAMRSGAEPSPTEACISRFVEDLRLEIMRLQLELDGRADGSHL